MNVVPQRAQPRVLKRNAREKNETRNPKRMTKENFKKKKKKKLKKEQKDKRKKRKKGKEEKKKRKKGTQEKRKKGSKCQTFGAAMSNMSNRARAIEL